MKTFKGLMLVGFVAVCGAFGLAACGDETGETTGGSSSSSSSSTSTSSSSSTSTSSSSSGSAGLSCASYCDTVMKSCTAANAQYKDAAECTAACGMLDAAGKLGKEGETMGDTVGCRQYHAGVAGMMMPETHCAHGGPFGGGACGDLCENFCALAVPTCGTDAASMAEYKDAATCMTTCKTFDATKAYSIMETAGNTLACRMYHLTVAVADKTHCQHITTGSDPCK